MSEMTHSKKFAGLLASFTVIIMVGANLIMSMTIDFSTMMFVFQKVIPTAFLMGLLGHWSGKILDNPKGRKSKPKKQ